MIFRFTQPQSLSQGMQQLNYTYIRRSQDRSSRSQMFFKIGALFRNIHRKTLVLESLFNKVAGMKTEVAKFLRAAFFTEKLQWLLLKGRQKHHLNVQNVPQVSGSSFECLGQVDASILDEIFENEFLKFLKYFKI